MKLGESFACDAKEQLAFEDACCCDGGRSARWPASGGLANDEAAKVLAGSSAGLRPDLSRRGYRFAKRAFDLVASGAAIAALLLPGLALSAVICAKSPGAGPLYGQTRVGRLNPDGTYRLFRMWKFRSMVPHADEMLGELEELNEADGPLFKIREDPRVIPGVGRFIRHHSLDELPQLVNVFLGDMSLIGPRPGLPAEVLQYDERAKRRLTVKPGCGGPWQVGSRSDGTFEEMVDLDLEYAENCSVGYDLKLIVGTLRAMAVGEGAY
ncbi:sugar transferase [Adlercreutzia sp. ZJ242]|uniref:sugar transferase n=1 Tax=Adlercreutzia sp. ZJ242 TaxID=2709409 RepID=UPI0019821E00|nr:sugar transferase [Adlercreutzia sp. ZJ242]